MNRNRRRIARRDLGQLNLIERAVSLIRDLARNETEVTATILHDITCFILHLIFEILLSFLITLYPTPGRKEAPMNMHFAVTLKRLILHGSSRVFVVDS